MGEDAPQYWSHVRLILFSEIDDTFIIVSCGGSERITNFLLKFSILFVLFIYLLSIFFHN